MNLIAKKISEARKIKGLTQEELADRSNINLRTIQRIENDESEPRGKTLKLICDVLHLDVSELMPGNNSQKDFKLGTKIVNGLFLVIINILLVGVIGFMTLDSEANLNSKFAGFLLSILLPFFIVILTKTMHRMERLLKFGFGYIAYFVLVMILHGFAVGFVSGLFPCLLISISILYFGGELMNNKE